MNFFFGINNSDFSSELQIPKFKNINHQPENIKLYRAYPNNNIWRIEEFNNKKRNEDFYFLDKEEINYELEDLALVVNKHYPDVRKILNTCQVNTVDSTLKIDKAILSSNSYKDGVLKELKSPSKSSFKNIRQTLADSNLDDFEEIYRFLYDSLDEYGNSDLSKALIVIEIENYMYHANFRIDKEINVMALLASILKIINNK